MLFAAGFGTRMGALTTNRPKPLIPVAGRALLDHALEIAAEAKADPIVVNTHYLGAQIADHVQGRGILVSDESAQILETGGGLRKALPLLKKTPVATLNTDAVWTGQNPLLQLEHAWRDDMGALLLLAPAAQIRGHSGKGDFTLHPDGRITRGGPLTYLGAQILDPQGLGDIAEEVFSLNLLWDRLIAEGRAHGICHAGLWCDVGRPEGIAIAEAMLAEGNVSND